MILRGGRLERKDSYTPNSWGGERRASTGGSHEPGMREHGAVSLAVERWEQRKMRIGKVNL